MSKYSLTTSKKKNNKNNKKGNNNSRMSFSQTKDVSKYTNKHGQAKLNKLSGKEKRIVYSECTHHLIGKNGKPKSRIVSNGDGTASCRICGQRFPMKGYTKEETKKLVAPVCGSIQQLKWILQAGGGDQQTMDQLAKTNYSLLVLPKITERIQTTYQRQNQNKKKKNRGGQQMNQYGSWKTHF